METKTILIAVALFAAGAATGWYAAGVANSPVEAPGKARCPRSADADGVGRASIADVGSFAAMPKRKVPIRSAKSEPMALVESSGEKPKEDVGERVAGNDTKPENPFPSYLDMFKNNPAAFAAEFKKEAEKDRAYQRELRDEIIAKLKLNAEQAAVFEKALDNLRDEITKQYLERVELITSGQLNEEGAADGCIWGSNRILQYKLAGDIQALICNTAEELYEQLDLDGVSNANKQEFLFWAARQTSFSYECLEPNLSVYDKVYKNFGVGNGIFSWCVRQRQKK